MAHKEDLVKREDRLSKMKADYKNFFIRQNIEMLTDQDAIERHPVIHFANIDYQKLGNFNRPLKVSEMLEKAEDKPGIKFEFIGKYARVKNVKANAVTTQIGNHPIKKASRFIVINKEKK